MGKAGVTGTSPVPLFIGCAKPAATGKEENMKYVVTSVWKHPETIDWREMRKLMSGAKGNPNVAEIHWYKIDETTHGSVAIYHSKEAYEANLAFQEEHRSESTSERGIQMVHEHHGESYVDFTRL